MIFMVIISIYLFCYITTRITCGRCKSKVCLIGKTAIVTGGNSGIGYETALNLASRGCKVIIADKDDATQSKNKIIAETNNFNIIAKYLDLASFKSIRQFVKEIIESEERLDILINNAGIGGSSLVYTEDGLQKTMQVNYFGSFLLTTLLVDLLKKSAPSRIIFVSSFLIFVNNLSVENLNPPSDFKDTTIFNSGLYANSKLCLVIAANMFAEKLKNSGVTSNSLHPGGVRTNIFRISYKEDGCFNHLFATLLTILLGKSAREGAETSIHLAVANEVKHVTGKYFWDCVQFFTPPKVKNKKLCKQIWQLSEKYVKLEEHEKLI